MLRTNISNIHGELIKNDHVFINNYNTSGLKIISKQKDGMPGVIINSNIQLKSTENYTVIIKSNFDISTVRPVLWLMTQKGEMCTIGYIRLKHSIHPFKPACDLDCKIGISLDAPHVNDEIMVDEICIKTDSSLQSETFSPLDCDCALSEILDDITCTVKPSIEVFMKGDRVDYHVSDNEVMELKKMLLKKTPI